MLLRLEKPRMNGPAVRRVQEVLLDLGYDLGPYGADGVFGPSTAAAVEAFQAALGLKVDGWVGVNTWKALDSVEGGVGEPSGEVDQTLPEWMADRRPWARPRPELDGGFCRVWHDPKPGEILIDGVMFHQTGSLVVGARGKEAERWDTLNAHLGVARKGLVVFVNDPTRLIWHGQTPSKTLIGIEYSGNMEGIEGVSSTLSKDGGGPHPMTLEQKQLSRRLFDWTLDLFRRNGGKFKKIRAHRQAKGSRRGDPGSAIWQEAALLWIQWLREAGEIRPDEDPTGGWNWKYKSGRPIPRQWDPSRMEEY